MNTETCSIEGVFCNGSIILAGIVLDVKEDSFSARMIDLTETTPDKEVEFPLEEVSDKDKHLIEPGAIFYVCERRLTTGNIL